ncbi:MAG: IS5 family transposase [Thermoplasmata archaeon]
MSRWGKLYKDHRDWSKYTEELVVRGEFILDLSFVDNWYSELNEMNYGKRGSPFIFPKSFMKWIAIWHQFTNYRALEGITRQLAKMKIIPYSADYSTICYRVQHMKPIIKMPDYYELEIGTDGTGLKTSNAGEYRIWKYGDPDAKKKKHLVVIITAEVRKKRIISIEAHIEGEGKSEPEMAEESIDEIVSQGYKVNKFYGDGAFDTNRMFGKMHEVGGEAVIKIRSNASPDNIRGSKWRRKESREYKKKGYKKWSEEKGYGMRWPGTEGIFSAVKRAFGENTVSRSKKGIEAEGYQRFWVYNVMKLYGESKVKEENIMQT